MVFELDSEISHYASDNSTSNKVIQAIQNLALTHREGKHFVICDLSTSESLSIWERLDQKSQATFRKIANTNSQNFAIKSSVSHKIRIIHENPIYAPIGGSTAGNISLPITHFVDSETTQKSILLAETIIDGKFYQFLGTNWLEKNNLARLSLSLELQMGGGGGCHQPFTELQVNGKRTCVCILDGDKFTPSSKFGDTACQVMKSATSNNELCTVIPCDCRDIENLFPISLLKEIIHGSNSISSRPSVEHLNSIAKLESLVAGGLDEAFRYIEMKSRSKIGDYTGSEQKLAVREYWAKVFQRIGNSSLDRKKKCKSFCDSKENCDCIVLNGLGGDLLVKSVATLSRLPDRKRAEILNEQNASYAERERIGKVIASFGIAAIKQIT